MCNDTSSSWTTAAQWCALEHQQVFTITMINWINHLRSFASSTSKLWWCLGNARIRPRVLVLCVCDATADCSRPAGVRLAPLRHQHVTKGCLRFGEWRPRYLVVQSYLLDLKLHVVPPLLPCVFTLPIPCVPMPECWGQLSCKNSTFPIVMLDRTAIGRA